MPRSRFGLALLSAAALFAFAGPLAPPNRAAAQDAEGRDAAIAPYRKPTIDVGVLVSDVKAAEEFYKATLGFKKLEEFTVPEQIAGDSGLTDYRTFSAHVMAIGSGENATRIKLIEMPGRPPARVDNRFVNSTYGPSYLTLHVTDMDPILKAAADHKLKPLAKGPADLGGGRYLALLRDPDGNFIELVGGRASVPTPDGPVEEATEDAAEAAGDAVEDAGDAIKAVGDAVENATDEAADEE